ncbi:furin-like isoform X1 [Acanthaster planci]|uniref:Furin-like isoform X1 n=1 Tax=Acanthaster planci TaxID=133434 RepID=A0A8B7ZKZ3_ACAPL|nr:furin-like isoform X1 [Acanthaster planci]
MLYQFCGGVLTRMTGGIRTLPLGVLFVLSLQIVCLSSSPNGPRSGDGSKPAVFTNTYAVHISGGIEKADELAEKHGFVNLGKIVDNHYHFLDHHAIEKRSLSSNKERHLHLKKEEHVHWVEQQVAKSRMKRDSTTPASSQLNDPKWPLWYLQREPGLDMNVIPAWKKDYTGTGVVVSILDDGIEKNHPDLSANYDPVASYDVNSRDDDPQPRYDFTNENRHGTRCAGEVAALANNSICSVGIAYNARIGGVRMLDGDVTDAVEARSLSHRPDHVDIYSASWGPDDDGKTVDGPGPLAKTAFCEGITKGRGGLGSIFIWASGNGGRSKDSCSCDGYTNSIYTISVSSVSERGNIPWYSEPCASTIATTYSSGSSGEQEVITTDLNLGCTDKHSGTSASAPLAAGICALALQANPHLTWRDLQHIIVLTSRWEHLNAPDWMSNGVGRKVSHSYGYGLMDADAMVTVAKTWNRVPEQHICTENALPLPKEIPSRGKLVIHFNTTGCGGTSNYVEYLEHVHARLTLSFSRRGSLTIKLTSPLGTEATLLPARPRDFSKEGFTDWDFMSVHSWGESPAGTWTLVIQNTGERSYSGTLKHWTLVMYGTEVHPLEDHIGPNNCPKGEFLSTDVRTHSDGLVDNTSIVHTCQPCHSTCETCFGPSEAQCLTCPYSYIKRDVYCITVRPYDQKIFLSMLLMCVVLLGIFLLFFLALQAYSQGFCSWNYSGMSKQKGCDYEYQELTKDFDSDPENEDSVLYTEKPISTVSHI